MFFRKKELFLQSKYTKRVSYGWKMDKWIVLSFYIISWGHITVILAFCKHYIFFMCEISDRVNHVCFTMTMHLITKHPEVPGREEYRRTRITYLFYRFCSVSLSFFTVKGTRFDVVEAIKRTVMTVLRSIPDVSLK